MKSLRIASFVSILCALWLPNYAEETKVKVSNCAVDNKMPGALELKEINTSQDSISSTKLELKQELTAGLISIKFLIEDAEGNAMMDQTNDLCSMVKNDMFKVYFESFKQPEFPECNVAPGSYMSGNCEVTMDDAPGGNYKITINIMEGPQELACVTCDAEVVQ